MARTTSKGSGSDVPVAAVVVPAQSNFDFLEGAFASSQRNRRLGLLVTLAALGTLTALVLLGVQGMLATRTVNSNLALTTSRARTAQIQLNKVDNVEGYNRDELTAHVNGRTVTLQGALGSEVDVVRISQDVQAASGAGRTLSRIVFAAAPTSTATTSGKPTGITTGSTGTPPNAGTTASASFGTVTITGTVTSFAGIGSWSQDIAKIKGLTAVSPTWTGGGDAVQVTITANITSDGLTKRALAATTGGH